MSLLKHCADGNLTEIKAILVRSKGRGHKVQARDNHNWTCLHHAVKSGNVECVKFLLTINELDTTAETYEGETALFIACSIPDASLEIVSMLIEANPDLVNYVNNEETDLLKCAIAQERLDILQLLIDKGTPVNKQDLDGDTALHVAAIQMQLDVVVYLLYDAQCDATIRNERERTAAFFLYVKLLEKLMENLPVSSDEIDCFEELAHYTYDSHNVNDPSETDLSEMICFGYQYEQPKSCLYASILKLYYVPPSKQYFVQKILQSNVKSCHCLIVALLAHTNTENFEDIFTLWEEFLLELLYLFLWNESFFLEYISEIMSNGSNYFAPSQVTNCCTFIRENKDSIELQQLFSFFKTLISYDFDLDMLMRYCEPLLMPAVTLTTFVPLAKSVIPWCRLGSNYLGCNYNFNESDDVFHDLNRWKGADIGNEVVSLKNLSRMSIRRYYFQTYSHYSAVKALYSLNIPMQIRNFLCYNVRNFEF